MHRRVQSMPNHPTGGADDLGAMSSLGMSAQSLQQTSSADDACIPPPVLLSSDSDTPLMRTQIRHNSL